MEKTVRKPARIVIYTKDIEVITGLRPGAARRLYLAIKEHYQKSKKQVLTADEFCLFLGIKEESIQQQLRV